MYPNSGRKIQVITSGTDYSALNIFAIVRTAGIDAATITAINDTTGVSVAGPGLTVGKEYSIWLKSMTFAGGNTYIGYY